MAKQKRGKRSLCFDAPPVLTAWASVAGKKESEGPLQGYFDYTNADTYFGEKTWEKAECHMQEIAMETLLQKAGKQTRDVDLVFSGDLLNQCISSSFALRNTGLPSLGLYGACSTMAESLLLASMAVSGGFADLGAAIPLSSGLRRPAHAHRPVDGDRVRRRIGFRTRRGAPGRGRHCGDHCRLRGDRRQQHGRGHGAQRLRDHPRPL